MSHFLCLQTIHSWWVVSEPPTNHKAQPPWTDPSDLNYAICWFCPCSVMLSRTVKIRKEPCSNMKQWRHDWHDGTGIYRLYMYNQSQIDRIRNLACTKRWNIFQIELLAHSMYLAKVFLSLFYTLYTVRMYIYNYIHTHTVYIYIYTVHIYAYMIYIYIQTYRTLYLLHLVSGAASGWLGGSSSGRAGERRFMAWTVDCQNYTHFLAGS